MYDVVVIGSGPGGYVAAIRAAQKGGKVACIEKASIGGTCLNRGCIPTKALVQSANVYQAVLGSEEFGVKTSGVCCDFSRVMQRKKEVVSRLVEGVERLFASNGVELVRGTAQIEAPGVVTVNQGGKVTKLNTRSIIIATGSCPELPPVSEESLSHTISSDDALELTEIPESMVVIGGGVLGVEFACIYRAFGTEIDIIKRSPLILPPIDEELSKRLMPILKKQGIRINTGIYIKQIVEAPGGGKRVIADTKDGKEVHFDAEKVLVAMGRKPDFGGLDLQTLGISYDRKGIHVNERMETSVSGIYAIGDVVGRFYLAPVASAEGIVAADNAMGEHRSMDYSVVPQCVFSMPEVAGVGLTEREAKEKHANIRVSKFPFSANGKAVAMGETDGLVKIVSDAGGKILGVHILGPHATDLIHEGAVALAKGSSAADIAHLVHAHPTLAETVMEAAHGILGQPIHLAKVR